MWVLALACVAAGPRHMASQGLGLQADEKGPFSVSPLALALSTWGVFLNLGPHL